MEMPFTPLILSEDLPIAINYFEKATKLYTHTYEISITGKDGKLRLLNVTNFPMAVERKTVGAYGIAKDMTEKVKYSKRIEGMVTVSTR